MKWLELTVEAPREFAEPLTAIFLKYGHAGVAVEEQGGFNPDEGEQPPENTLVKIMTYLPLDNTTKSRENGIDVGVKLLSQIGPVSSLKRREIDEADWEHAWKEHFHVLRIGTRIVIVPTWRVYDSGPGDIVVSLDPGMAFGTGHHPTTAMCLAVLDELLLPGCAVLDVGCGSGILSIASAKLGAKEVIGLDVDTVAVEVATTNVKQNNVSDVVSVRRGTLPLQSTRPSGYDLVVANISAVVIEQLAGEMVSALRPGGTILISGLLVEKVRQVLDRFEEIGLSVCRQEVDGDWAALSLIQEPDQI